MRKTARPSTNLQFWHRYRNIGGFRNRWLRTSFRHSVASLGPRHHPLTPSHRSAPDPPSPRRQEMPTGRAPHDKHHSLNTEVHSCSSEAHHMRSPLREIVHSRRHQINETHHVISAPETSSHDPISRLGLLTPFTLRAAYQTSQIRPSETHILPGPGRLHG